MTDRELLEKAAKAAGYVIESFRSNGGAWCYPVDEQPDEDGDHPGLFPWHPIDDDRDALRLAVKLEMVLSLKQYDVFDPGLIPDAAVCSSIHDSRDPYAATRRAIVMAAAAIGEAMP